MKKIIVLTWWSIVLLTIIILTDCEKEDYYPENLVEGKIAFDALEGLKSNIYVLDQSGLNKITFADDLYFKDPEWSPDGSRITFLKGSLFGGLIYLMEPDGSSQVLVDSITATSPSWSPNGEELCFSKPFGGDIYKIRLDGTGLNKVVDVEAGDPEWSPDGAQIVFWNAVDNFEIFSVKIDGSELTNLTNSEYPEESPTWSPDGSMIAYSRNEPEGGYNIYIMNIDGSNITQVTQMGSNRNAISPRWSPDGTQIAFVENRNIYVINIDGSDLKIIYNGELDVMSIDWH